MSWGGRHAQRLTALVLATYGDRCHLCGELGADTADHLIPRAVGGDDSLENMRPAHRSCNCSRQDMPLAEWRARRIDATRASRAQPSRPWL
ncbi:HNH endonuclease [Corynebacterium diphtheriae]|uniref:HNH endonuclease n=1 Tax=Corynebacterium diphtheriae TaxID=1717 RepID=UPI0008FB96E6|nr:HNH endonuclease signature motif containing protein [Corynebacterium diphtheriae]MBG9355894.1 HNH endonuclease [Corynebacterium diphtheriae bv. mitis]OIR92178.1 HNH endonuclease [Corynebacterium diphtheriae]OIR96062.1 HNH endonuclease [Corynebacterium diphtheriae]OIR98055.1 HNH endonuclease [Corynebacterium diphtheriae]TBX16036.1 HNH endonuclease [Corynebacterium diphtheriae]